MTFPPGNPGPSQSQRVRPGAVTTAAIMMFLLSLASLAWAAILIVSLLVISDKTLESQMRETQPQVTGEELEAMVSFAKGLGYATAALIGVLGIALAVLAVLVIRGSRVARILSWVTAGVYVFCGLCTSATAGIGLASGVRGGVVALLFPLVTLIGALAVVILLALPVSNEYFARPVQSWQAPAGFGPATPPASPPPTDGLIGGGPDTPGNSSS